MGRGQGNNTKKYQARNRRVHPWPGHYITIEGPDGAGKTLLGERLAQELKKREREVLLLREPGGTPLGEFVRDIVKHHIVPLSDARAEALLFAAQRAELASSVIRPALERGAWVITDRGLGSSIIYQGLARGLGADAIRDLSLFALNDVQPDRVLSLTVSIDTARSRRYGRDGHAGDRIEQSLPDEMVREGYAQLGSLSPHEVVEVSAEGTPDETLEKSLEALGDLLAEDDNQQL